MSRVTLRERMQHYFSRHPIAAQLAIVALGVGVVGFDGARVVLGRVGADLVPGLVVGTVIALVALGSGWVLWRLVFDDGRRWGRVGEGAAAVVFLCFFVLSHPRRNDDAVDDAGLFALVVAVDVIFLGFLGYALIRRRRE